MLQPCVHSERKFSVCSGQKYKIKSKSKEQNREHVGLHMHRSHMRYRKHQKACRKIPERLRAENQAWPIFIFTRVICGAIQGMPVLQLYWPCSSQDMNLGLVELHYHHQLVRSRQIYAMSFPISFALSHHCPWFAMFLWICVVWSFAESRSVRSCRDHSEDCFDKVLKSPERRDRCNSPEFSRNCCASCLSLLRRLGARYRSSAALGTGMGQTLHCLVLITRWIYNIYRK